jgi:predicted acylesterase/phospholipase RssA
MWNALAGIANFFLLAGSWLYYLRVPLVAAGLLGLLPVAALGSKSLRPLLAGLFDVSGGSRHKTRSPAAGMFSVTLTAFGAAWSALLPFALILEHGCERFGHPWLDHAKFSYIWLVAFTIVAIPAIGVAWFETRRRAGVPRKPLAQGIAGGVALGSLLFAGAHLLAPLLVRSWAVRWLICLLSLRCDFAAGYLGPDPRHPGALILLPSHGLALGLFVLMGVVYVVAGRKMREPIPSLAYVHLLLMLLCWLLAGLSFFLDYFHIPILAVAIVAFCVASLSSYSDNFYTLVKVSTVAPLYPAEVLKAKKPQKVILVAASGGGIQAAAWTARVLTGLEVECRKEFRDDRFGRAIRLISAVSGGSVGAMYFVMAYENGGLPPERKKLERIVQRAEASTLEEIAWGLAYPDFWRNVFPFLWLVKKNRDRGNALEEAWEKIDPNLEHGLSEWRAEVRAGERPAVIFNATIVETGQRLILSTTDFEHGGTSGRDGRRNFYRPPIYPERDLAIATAVRLSASFPYVAPAARACEDGPYKERFHVVDGGYYDNYGVASLLEWLDQALEGWSGPQPEMLILQIRDAAPSTANVRARHRGWIYQAGAPLKTLMNVRDTAQPAYNEFAVKTLIDKYSCRSAPIRSVVFEFQGKHPPLSWHMTPQDKERIESVWETCYGVQRSIAAVKEFLAGRPV